jgi:hypothetical protein
MDSGDKATNKAMSVAHKYALIQVFAIPTADDKDPENESPQPAPKKPEPKPEAPKETDIEISRRATLMHLEKNEVKLSLGKPEMFRADIAKAKSNEDLRAIYKEITEDAKNGQLEVF